MTRCPSSWRWGPTCRTAWPRPRTPWPPRSSRWPTTRRSAWSRLRAPRQRPVGGPDQPDYVNAVVLARTTLSPTSLLRQLHAVEASFDRGREVRWGARTLDLDLVQYGDPATGTDVISDRERLTLPHPRAHERAFVLVPWLDADPEAVLRVDGDVVGVADLVAALDTSDVRRRPDTDPGGLRPDAPP